MSVSFVDYKDFGFWCEDAYLEVWTYLFVCTAKKVTSGDVPSIAIINKVCNEWIVQATLGFVGCINLDLNNIVSSENDIKSLVFIAERLHKELIEFGSVIPDDIMTYIERDIKGIKWIDPPLVSNILKVGVYFIELLDGRLPIKVDSPLLYLNPEEWSRLSK